MVLTITLACITPSHAQWIQGQASMPISTIGYEEIRTQTIKNAVANASVSSGTFIHLEEISLNGLLTSSKTTLQSYGNIRQVEIISETVEQDVLTVVVKVNIAQMASCEEARFKKSLLVTLLPLKKPKQAAHGQLYNLGRHVTNRLSTLLSTQENIFVRGITNQPLVSAKEPLPLQSNSWRDTAQYLQGQHDSQLILLGFIQDISLFDQSKEGIIFDDVKTRRNFTLSLILYDAIEQKILLNESYHGESDWPYQDHYSADMNNSLFWRDNFGRMVINTLSGVAEDIQEKTVCVPLYARVVEQDKKHLYISVNKNQGINETDTFSLIQQREFSSFNGVNRRFLNNDGSGIYSATKVNQELTQLTGPLSSKFTHHALGDIVTPTLNNN